MRYSFDPSSPENRILIEAHKAARLANPWGTANFKSFKICPDLAHQYWVEQIGDAELYEEAATGSSE